MNPGYAAIGIYIPGQSKPSLLSVNNKVVVFDTPDTARDFLPALGQGRMPVWSADLESVCFVPLDPNGVNRAMVITGYDVYNLPPGLPVLSETRLMAWRNHVHWGVAFEAAAEGSAV